MRSLVLGGCGFIGSHLVRRLARDEAEIKVLDLGPSLHHPEEPGCAYLYGSWQDSSLLSEALEGVSCVYHLIGTVQLAQANEHPAEDLQRTGVDSVRLLEACVSHAVKRVVYVSSGGAVYGLPRTVPIAEDHPTEPISAHGISKLAVEKYLRLFAHLHGLEHQIARCSNPYGEWQDPLRGQGAAVALLWRTLRREPVSIWGDGSVVRDYVYVGDVADALARLGTHPEPNRIFNVGSGVGTSLIDLLGAIARVAGLDPIVQYAEARQFDVQMNVLDVTSLQRATGWCPSVQLEEGLRRTQAWLEDFGRGKSA